MAILVNGIKVAGIGSPGMNGADGKSAYQSAVEAGYTGTEAEFNASLSSIGNINAVLDEINGEVV